MVPGPPARLNVAAPSPGASYGPRAPSPVAPGLCTGGRGSAPGQGRPSPNPRLISPRAAAGNRRAAFLFPKPPAPGGSPPDGPGPERCQPRGPPPGAAPTCDHLLRVVGLHVAVVLPQPLGLPLPLGALGVVGVGVVLQDDDLGDRHRLRGLGVGVAQWRWGCCHSAPWCFMAGDRDVPRWGGEKWGASPRYWGCGTCPRVAPFWLCVGSIHPHTVQDSGTFLGDAQEAAGLRPQMPPRWRPRPQGHTGLQSHTPPPPPVLVPAQLYVSVY